MSRIGSKFGLIGSGSAMGGGGIYPPAGKINADLDVFLTLEANAKVVAKAQADLDIILDTEPQAVDFKAVSANLDIVLDSDVTAAAGGDPDVAAYITAASIVDTTEIAAIEQLFSDLKGTGSTTNNSNIYSKFHALYPISPTSLAAAAVNAVNPGTYDITWFNSPTHSTSGVVGNGSNKYGDTGVNASTVLTSNDNGATVAINNTNTSNGNDFGIRSGTTQAFEAVVFSNAFRTRIQVASLGDQMIDSTTPFDNVHTMVRRGSTDAEYYLNGSSAQTSAITSGTLPNGNIFIMGENLTGTGLNGATARQYCFFAIHGGLTDNEAQDLYDAITTYNANVIGGGR